MKQRSSVALMSFLLLSLSLVDHAASEQLRIAVASNFRHGMLVLQPDGEKQLGTEFLISSGSTGKLYAQIRHGAPFDVFLSADEKHPKLLEEGGFAVVGTRTTYALGRMVFWSRDEQPVAAQLEQIAKDASRKLAIADPRVAPYGQAAKGYLETGKLWSSFQPRIVMGENINQTFQFVASGAANAGFVALSQVLALPEDQRGQWQALDSHPAIVQQAVIIRDGEKVREFMRFLVSDSTRSRIEELGYHLPSPKDLPNWLMTPDAVDSSPHE